MSIKIGPLELNFINIAIDMKSGEPTIKNIAEKKISKKHFMNK